MGADADRCADFCPGLRVTGSAPTDFHDIRRFVQQALIRTMIRIDIRHCEYHTMGMATTTRMTLTIPKDLERELRGLPNKSAFVASAIRERLARAAKLKAAGALALAYAAAGKEDSALLKEWDTLSGDAL